MDRAEIEVSPESWEDLVTKYAPDSPVVKIANFTDGTKNIDTDNTGNIVKRKGMVDYSTLPSSPKDQYEAIFSDGVHHLLTVDSGNLRYSSGDGVENLVTAGYSASLNFEFATIKDRVYFGNTVTAQVYDRTTTYGGVVYTAPKTKVMGSQAPTTSPTVAVAAGGAVPVGAHTYKITFVYYGFEESNGGPASAVATTTPGNQTVNLTSVEIGGYGVTSRKIYRDNNDGVWVHVGTIADNTATVFSDMVATGATPTPIPTDNGAPPAFGLISLWLDRAWISRIPGEPYTLAYSDAGLPDIFPANNRRICNQQDPISGHLVYRGRLVVWNRNSMGYIEGTTPETFNYVDIQGSVGCVDNRTLQIRVVEGVPIVVWLSDKGFYTYNGSSIDYLSDPIEDLVNFNIQQAVLQKGRNSQTTQSDFTGGTASNGINLTTSPGFITTRGYENGSSTVSTNPRRNFDDQGDWEAGLTTTNIATKDGSNQLKVPLRYTIPFYRQLTASGGSQYGTFEGAEPVITSVGSPFPITFGQLSLTSRGNFSSGDNTGATNFTQPLQLANYFVQKFSIPQAGTVNSLSMRLRDQVNNGSAEKGRFVIISDLGGTPNTVLFTGNIFTVPSNSGDTLVSDTMAWSLAAGTYWIGFENLTTAGAPGGDALSPRGSFTTIGGMVTPIVVKYKRLGVWTDYTTAPLCMSMGFCQSPVSGTGRWTSDIYDSLSGYTTGLSINIAGTYPSPTFCSGVASTSSTITVEGSDEPTFISGPQVSESVTSLNGAQSLAVAGKRYWRIKILLSTTDDRSVPTVGVPTLKFATTATFVSQTIDVTSDVTALNSLTIVDSQPAGTSIVYTIATSNDDITYPDGFVTFGTQVNRRYVRIRAILSTDAADTVTPSVTSIVLKWTIVSNLISSIIDTAASPPAGWDVFQAVIANTGAGITFQMRSATTSGGIPAATFFTVTNGDFPGSVTPLQFVQWKVIITATDGSVPSVDSVTINWFIGNTNNIRPASIFFGGRYYVALAEFDQLTNNLVLVLDLKGKWRLYRGLNIATFSLFFNQPYAGLSNIGRITKFLQGLTDRGSNIEIDIRTPAHDFSTYKNNNIDRYKVVHKFFLIGKNTGATYQVFFSVDEGVTFTAMLDDTGASSFVTPIDGKAFYKRLQASHADGNLVSGRTIMYRIYSNDAFDIDIAAYRAQAFVRKGEPVVTS